jgi:hypothetical protein
MAGGGMPISTGTVAGGYLTGKALIFPLSLVISLFFLWGFSYGLLDGKHLSQYHVEVASKTLTVFTQS